MKEIKFRAWDKTEKQMGNVVTMSSGCDGKEWGWFAKIQTNLFGQYETNPSKNILMQFTSLHDKNGKEIWEGDVVKWPYFWDTSGYHIGEVRWNIGHWDIHDEKTVNTEYLEEFNTMIEVIGNIYENPELMEETP